MLSITFHTMVHPSNKRRDGTYPVKIRVYFNGKSRILPTNQIARPGDLTRSLHIKNPDILNRSAELIKRMQATIADLSIFDIEGWDVDQVVAYIRGKMLEQTFRLDIFEFGDKFIAGKTENTRRVYEGALRSFEHFLGKRKCDINDITKSLILDWREFISKGNKKRYNGGVWSETSKKQGGGQASRLSDKLAHIYKAAQLQYNDEVRELIPRHPFDNLPKYLPAANGQRNLGADVIQRMIDKPGHTWNTRFAINLFLLSFCTMGANLADIWEAHDVGKVWHYNRRKTRTRRADRAAMQVVIYPEAERILERLGAEQKGLWIPRLRSFAGSSDLCTQRVNNLLRAWAKREGLEGFTFYAARHTWASLARKAGVEKATIDECLCHIGDFPVADIYIERDWELLNEANRKTLALLKWPKMPKIENSI